MTVPQQCLCLNLYRFQNSSSCPKFRIKAHQHTQAFGWEPMQMSACLKRRGEGFNATAADRAIEPALGITLQLHQHFPLEKALCFSIAVSWEVWSHEQWENAFCCLSLRGSRTEVTCSFPFYNERTQLTDNFSCWQRQQLRCFPRWLTSCVRQGQHRTCYFLLLKL